MKCIYRKKVSTLDGENQILLNVAYDYLSNSIRRESYDPNDVNKFQRVEFEMNLLILKKEITLINLFLEESRKLDFDVNVKGKNDMSMLYLASRCGYIDVVKYLIQSGSDPSIIQGNQSSALHAASFYGHKDIVKLLLQIGVDANLKNQYDHLAEEEAFNNDIKNLIQNFKSNDKSYKFFETNRDHFLNVKFLFDDNNFIGKRAKLKCRNPRRNHGWDVSWHGTKLEYIPSIIRNGLKKCGESVEGKVLDIRRDKIHIERGINVRNIPDWASAVFTSKSIFYSSSECYAEHFKDLDGEEWILILECRLEKNKYTQHEHTFSKYTLRKNEDKLVENRSTDSNSVDIFAIWQFKKDFINKQQDMNEMMNKLNKYIYE
jgi:Ankyrin repeats (3 copies)